MYGPDAEHHTAELTNLLYRGRHPHGRRPRAGGVRDLWHPGRGGVARTGPHAGLHRRRPTRYSPRACQKHRCRAQRMGEADEIAAAVAFLLGPDARWLTGKAYSDQFEASVDRENLPRQPRCGGICEADDPGRDFPRLSPPSQRDPGCLLLLDLHHLLLG